MTAIVDYGVGNLFSLASSLQYIGADATVTGDADVIGRADKIILPGVGAFGDAAEKLRRSGLGDVLRSRAQAGVPLLGICLGMQLLFEASDEHGAHPGLGLLKGRVVSMAPHLPPDCKVPHIGWNALRFPEDREKSPLFARIQAGDHVYFVHSFYATDCPGSVIATTEYGIRLTAAVAEGFVFGTQFHPEKSGETGLNILRAFCGIGRSI